MTPQRARIAAVLIGAGLIGTLVALALHHRSHRAAAPGGGVIEPASQAAAAGAGLTASATPDGQPPEPYGDITARRRARSALQACLKKAELAAKTSWDGMCASLAQQTADRREGCRQAGRTALDCRTLYAETPLRDCLLPHETASSIAQARQSANSDCYLQFQAEMR